MYKWYVVDMMAMRIEKGWYTDPIPEATCLIVIHMDTNHAERLVTQKDGGFKQVPYNPGDEELFGLDGCYTLYKYKKVDKDMWLPELEENMPGCMKPGFKPETETLYRMLGAECKANDARMS